VIDTLNAKLEQALRSPELAQRMGREGFDPLISSPAKTDAMVAAEMTRWAGIVKDAGIQAN
jgi:tripartite-type tricarboxylate transporter receptor subunit TctC